MNRISALKAETRKMLTSHHRVMLQKGGSICKPGRGRPSSELNYVLSPCSASRIVRNKFRLFSHPVYSIVIAPELRQQGILMMDMLGMWIPS